jgi:hypothetical protein
MSIAASGRAGRLPGDRPEVALDLLEVLLLLDQQAQCARNQSAPSTLTAAAQSSVSEMLGTFLRSISRK